MLLSPRTSFSDAIGDGFGKIPQDRCPPSNSSRLLLVAGGKDDPTASFLIPHCIEVVVG